jgi:hypothetical protein
VAEFAVGFYGSAGSLRALRWAAGVGIRWPASLRIVTVHDGTDSGNAESIADTAVRQLTEWARRRSRRLVA